VGNVTQATTGDAATRRQLWQWQIMLLVGSPLMRYRIAPQTQPPSENVVDTLPPFRREACQVTGAPMCANEKALPAREVDCKAGALAESGITRACAE
jgi:hypothetical protein